MKVGGKGGGRKKSKSSFGVQSSKGVHLRIEAVHQHFLLQHESLQNIYRIFTVCRGTNERFSPLKDFFYPLDLFRLLLN